MLDISTQDIRNLSNIIGDTNDGISGADIKRCLADAGIEILDDGKNQTRYTYTIGLIKRDHLYKCLSNEFEKYHSANRIIAFLNVVMDPGRYVKQEDRRKYDYLFEHINKFLRLKGYQYDKSGSLMEIPKADSLDDVDKLINDMNSRMYHRALHREVVKYCGKELLRKDNYDAVFEAAKGLEKRIQDMSGLPNTGEGLIIKAFDPRSPFIALNSCQTQTEKDETDGFIFLLKSIFKMYRNPAAHKLKCDWKKDQTETLDALTVISVAHKYLDLCAEVRKVGR